MKKTEQLGPFSLSWQDGVFPLGGDALALGEFAGVKPGWRVCDLGTGSGVLLLLLARRAENLSLTGIDIEPLSARIARENLAANGLPGEILTGDLRTVSLPAGNFDLVISTAVITQPLGKPVVLGIPFLTGINLDKTIDEIVQKLGW